MLDGLADVPWDELETAYGPATPLPALFDAVASGDRSRTDEATPRGDLGSDWGLIHQACVYSATAAAVPFLIRLAADPAVLVADQLIAAVASAAMCEGQEPDRPHGVRRAVAAQEQHLIGFLDHQDATVRASAATALGHADPPSPAAGRAMNDRMQVEPDPRVRAVLLVSAVTCDPTSGRDWVLQAYDDVDPEVGAAAVYAGARLNLPWTEDTTRVLHTSLLDGDPLPLSDYWFWDLDWWLPVALRGLRDYVLTGVLHELLASNSAAVRVAGVEAADQLLRWAQGATAELAPLLRDLAFHPDPAVRHEADRSTSLQMRIFDAEGT